MMETLLLICHLISLITLIYLIFKLIKLESVTNNIKAILSDFILRQKIAKDIGEDKKGFYYSRIDGPSMN